MTGRGASSSLLTVIWSRGRVLPARGPDAGSRVGGRRAELKQGERRELILLFRGHGQQAREGGGSVSTHLAAHGASLDSFCIVTSQLALA